MKKTTKAPAQRVPAARKKAPAALPAQISEILVPVDFSEQSRAAVQYALDFAKRFKARVALVHVVEQIVYPGDWVFAPVPGPAFVMEKTDDLADRLRELAGSDGKKIEPIVRLGRPWQQVVEVAQKRRSSLIITATHGYTGLKHVLLGSVAEKIVQHAACPVLTIRVP